jgi:hypothetical protein
MLVKRVIARKATDRPAVAFVTVLSVAMVVLDVTEAETKRRNNTMVMETNL